MCLRSSLGWASLNLQGPFELSGAATAHWAVPISGHLERLGSFIFHGFNYSFCHPKPPSSFPG